MYRNDIALIRDFYDRYKTISNCSGYALIYDTLSLIREFIPCREIGVKIGKIASEDPKNIWPKTPDLWVATVQMGHTQEIFHRMLPYIPYSQRAAAKIMSELFAGKPVAAISFADDIKYKNGFVDGFYAKTVQVSDVASVAGILNRHQFFRSPFTEGYYIIYMSMARDNGHAFTNREMQLISLFFDIFLEDFRKKISCPENSPFLPFLTTAKFHPRELATIRACFDLKLSGIKVTRASLANYLHLQDRKDCSSQELRKAFDKTDYDVKKIKATLLKDFEHDTTDSYNNLQNEIGVEHLTELFQSYAYFGLYPHIPEGNNQFISFLSKKLDKYNGTAK